MKKIAKSKNYMSVTEMWFSYGWHTRDSEKRTVETKTLAKI